MTTPDLQRALFRSMVRIRLVEEAIAERYSEQEMRCPVHLSIGQEGVAAGVCTALTADDVVMSTHRAHAHYLAKGGDLPAMLAEIYGKATGCASGKGGSMHLVDLRVHMLGSTPIVGSSLPVAVGTAFGAWLEGRTRATAIFFGEGATEEGTFAESLNFAALKQLPVIFVCENNLYSVYSPMDVRQAPARDRAAMARAHGIPTDVGDGNDVEAVYAATARAVARAHAGEGPTYLEFSTYRWREHCGPNFDNHIGYRTEAEFQQWRQFCPVENYAARLKERGILNDTAIASMKSAVADEIATAFQFAKSSPFPEPSSITTGIYADEVIQ